MSEAVKSPWDILASGQPGEVGSLRQRVSELDAKLGKLLAEGLSVEEYPFFQGLRAATEAALSIVEKAKA
jgi:hypothetical protein